MALIAQSVNSSVNKLMNDPEVNKRLNDNDIEVVTSKSPEAFAVFMKNENEKRAKVVKKVGVVMD